ncbi:hypothetical protein [Tellurirhabdus bombi]|uniref:hypothetical protein n=1 Tax=Tellurirhabdus bombi TaxID=2907205 RepID=UPI001F2CD8CE|nr:hypothetical protein [Tellurirhabdus bombi]
MIRLVLSIALFLFSFSTAFAQDTLAHDAYAKASRVVLKFSPMGLLNFDPTVQFGAEVRLARAFSWQAEAGYGRFLQSRPGLQTWRTRSELRWYLASRKRPRSERYPAFPLGRYFAVEGFYKQMKLNEYTSAGRGCEGGTCGYWEQVYAPKQRHVAAGYVKLGWQLPLRNEPLSPFVIDFYFGLGLRHIWVERPVFEGEFFGWNRGDILTFDRFRSTGSSTYPDLVVGFKVGYVLRKK